jgi:transketolase
MRILEVGDATEVESVLDVAEAIDGPVYIRMLRGEVPRLFPKTLPMKFGVVRALSQGSDIAVITTGICTHEGIKARKMIQSSGVSILHLHLSTIIPFPADAVVNAANRVKYGIITMENHSIVGGVGSATAEVLAEQGVSGKPLVRLGVPGVYAHGASREYLMAEYGIDALALVQAIEKLIGKKLVVEDDWNLVEETPASKKTERPEDL